MKWHKKLYLSFLKNYESLNLVPALWTMANLALYQHFGDSGTK